MEEEDFAKFLCHECHKHIAYDDIARVSGVEPQSEWDEAGCPMCVVPESPISVTLLLNPLYKCRCNKIMMVYIPDLFDCPMCMDYYNQKIAVISDIVNHSTNVSLFISEVRELDIFECRFPCLDAHSASLSRDSLSKYLDCFTTDSFTPNSDYKNIQK